MVFPGVCDCGPTASGSDCFVRTDESPYLFYLGNRGLCDLRKDSCNVVTVFNNNTVNINSLSCVFTKVQVSITTLVCAFSRFYLRAANMIPTMIMSPPEKVAQKCSLQLVNCGMSSNKQK